VWGAPRRKKLRGITKPDECRAKMEVQYGFIRVVFLLLRPIMDAR
jgi:hypothetical protein